MPTAVLILEILLKGLESYEIGELQSRYSVIQHIVFF